jgi:aspartate dehydrogenase
VSARPTLRLALVGAGAIGGAIVQAVGRSPVPVELVGALVANPSKPRPTTPIPVFGDLAALLCQRPAVVIECAGHAALRTHGPAILEAGVDLVPSSIGLFAQDPEAARFRAAAIAGGSRIRVPSGAVAGIDALLGARLVGLDTVRYRFVMSPEAWGHPIDALAAPAGTGVCVFRGSARDAALRFPKHANVTATLSLAGIGFERTEVELVVDPAADANRHEIDASGWFGTLSVVVHGQRIDPSSSSSRLVAGSLLQAALADVSLPF